jgi:zinc transporter ZupT
MFRLTLFLFSISCAVTYAASDASRYNVPVHHDATFKDWLLEAKKTVLNDQEPVPMTLRFLNETNEDHDHDHHEEEKMKRRWGEVIGLTLIVNLASLSGVLFLIPLLSRKARAWVKSVFWSNAVPSPELPKDADQADIVRKTHILDLIVPSFASGALLATAVFLIIPEAIALIRSYVSHDEGGEEGGHAHLRFLAINNEVESEVHDDHSNEISPDVIWRFGASLLGGFLIPIFIQAVAASFRHYDGDHCTTTENKFEDDDIEAKMNCASNPMKRSIKWGLVTTITVGDALCNFCDGVFVGVAVSLCSRTTAYTIMALTLYHEVGQELADYFLLTKCAGLKPLHALILNFASGLSVVLGGIVVLVTPISDLVMGVLLSVASGVYIYIAACECMPRIRAVADSSKDRIISIALVIIGAIPIGLALINHSHCEAEGH